MSALAQSQLLNTSTESVTSISVNARIDYIHRFSKHAILVVDENAQECSSMGFQFLDQLSAEHNAAFISASPKLNNIQMRCRIIEQLFSGSVFDPEQSLAVSIVNLLNANPQKLAIVIDNAQFASLQIMHELTQLALIAKKAQLAIDVLMLGNYDAGKMFAAHKDLFHKKLSILSRNSGQLLSLNAKEFKTPQSWLTLTPSKKGIIALTVLSLVAFMILAWLKQQDMFSFSKLPNNIAHKSTLVDAGDKMVLSGALAQSEGDLARAYNEILPEQVASSNYIFNVLTGIVSVKTKAASEPAQVSDIVSAIAAFEDASTEIKGVEILDVVPTAPSTVLASELSATRNYKSDSVDTRTIVDPIVKDVVIENLSLPVLSGEKINESYFKSFTRGFVIQISGFTQESIMQEFLADFNQLEFKQYKRILNNEVMTVLTSSHYESYAEAERAMSDLPETILARQPWIKSISAINNEINAFERSQ
ncbi:SPOR domain-containing protein [Thalassotalea profundi]|uniref:SPOR domain-containing protein n=1 Tax=Thalassotalea profundi TaxID=2036687 RepID=A0ABQ3J3Z8_9GAMM|nr:hypothetical protein [Thalassotalea profundi]GHF00166.1 hypothetical protein GCM10011501_32040 [Thalassotalea profundi]